jgi:WhiB family transcriptional regulator, redox-sensing transcriptional regulator
MTMIDLVAPRSQPDGSPRQHAPELARHWTTNAACRGKTNLFFPPQAERPQARVRREARARQLCQECPAQIACRDSARRNHEYGFWGGESEEERHLAGFTVAAPIGVRARAFAMVSIPRP